MGFINRYEAQRNVFVQPNVHTKGVMDLLKDHYPALAKKVMEGNDLVLKMVENNFSTVDILEHPICGRCEALALYCGYAKDKDGKPIDKGDGEKVVMCRCRKCGAITLDPITFLDWCMMELRKKAPMVTEEDLIGATNETAKRMMMQALWLLEKMKKERRYE